MVGKCPGQAAAGRRDPTGGQGTDSLGLAALAGRIERGTATAGDRAAAARWLRRLAAAAGAAGDG